MISLFNIESHIIDTSKFNNLLHGQIVDTFESNFRTYVNAKYSVSLNSATNAIFLISKLWGSDSKIPSLIPPVVANAIITSRNNVTFTDNISWIGNSYILDLGIKGFKVIDSAQKVERNQFKLECNDSDLMIFSLYPTKPLSSADGCVVVSNDKDKIELLKLYSFNGMSTENNNWERTQKVIGYKMYLASISAYIANENFKKLDEKKEALKKVRDIYNSEFGLSNTSDHLYRINRENRNELMLKAKEQQITLGIHYDCCHLNPIFGQTHLNLPNSEQESKTTVSIPYHEKLSKQDIEKVIKLVRE
jgi:dTDP-4-amino-4,6-dideoxygalactose transaminase